MSTPHSTIDSALAEADRLRKLLKKKSTQQVRSTDECTIVKATALAWFNTHRMHIVGTVEEGALRAVDAVYRHVLEGSDRATARATYDGLLKDLRSKLIGLRSDAVMLQPVSTSDQPPDFSPLIADIQMQAILTERWEECGKCLTAGAPLAATVMMGGLLEALLLGRVHRESNKAPIFQAASAPRDKGGQTRPLPEWTLRNYIDVAHELGWISVSAKDVGEVLRDYRNYVHPFKQLSHGVHLTADDAILLWEVSKAISRQITKP
jgi:hypothetical protein